jgi:CubicO group peptidase (beta-lactamase class C family)
MPHAHPWYLIAVLLFATAAHAEAERFDPLPPQPGGTAWPTQAWPEAPLTGDAGEIEAAADQLFSFEGRSRHPDTRALLVIHRGAVVYERYADEFGPDSRFRSWSAAKSVTQALAGRLVHQGRLGLDEPAPVPEWQNANDPRRVLTLRHLLNMTTGLDNADGNADTDGFVANLLFGREGRDSGGLAARARLIHEPGTHWAYSTASSQIVSRLLAREVGGGRAGTLAFVEEALSTPLGLDSLVIEFDASGTPLGGGFAWMSARDWARIGLLYLRDGLWEGQRLLPAGWVDFSRTRAPAPNNKGFAAHFWIGGEAAEGQPPPFDASLGTFQMSGNAGQFVVMFPSRDLIVVRLGEAHSIGWGELVDGISRIALAFPEVTP